MSPQGQIPRKNTFTSVMDFFRLKRSKNTNGCNTNRMRIGNNCHTSSGTIGTLEAHLHMIPFPSNGALSSQNIVNEVSGTPSIEKLYVSRKDNPVYSMLPQHDPCDGMSNQSPQRHLPITIETFNDEADWIRENTPPEHKVLIRSPPPIKRLDLPLYLESSSPLQTCHQSSVEEGSHQITRFITRADVCGSQQDLLNANQNNTYT